MSKRFIVNQPKAGQGIINAGGAMPGGEEPYLPPTLATGKEPEEGTAPHQNQPFQANAGNGEEPPYIPTTISFGKGTAARVNAASMGSEEPYVAPAISFKKPGTGKPSKTNEAPPAKATNEEEPYVSTAKLFDKKGGK